MCRGPRSTPPCVEALEQAGIDDPVARARQYPHELSGGLRQRVLIAIALAGDPDVIVADEPTSALDVTVQRRILDHLDALVRDRGIALVIITHDLGVAADRADRVVVLRDGVVVEQGDSIDVLAAPTTTTRGASSPRPRAAQRDVPPRESGGERRVLVRWEGVTKDFALPAGAASGTLRAVDEVTLEARAGRTLAIVGESGSGKTTLLRIALGLEKPTSGRVVFDDVDISALGWREARPLRRRFQLVQQNPFAALDPRFSVGRSIAEPLVSFGIGTRATRRARVAELLDLVATAGGCRAPASVGAVRWPAPAGGDRPGARDRARAAVPG